MNRQPDDPGVPGRTLTSAESSRLAANLRAMTSGSRLPYPGGYEQPDDPGPDVKIAGTPPYDPDRGLRLLERILLAIAAIGVVALALAVWRWWL